MTAQGSPPRSPGPSRSCARARCASSRRHDARASCAAARRRAFRLIVDHVDDRHDRRAARALERPLLGGQQAGDVLRVTGSPGRAPVTAATGPADGRPPRSGVVRRSRGDQRQHGRGARRQHRLAAAGALIQRMRAPSALIRVASKPPSSCTPPQLPAARRRPARVWARARRRPRGAGHARSDRARGRAQPPSRSPAGQAMRAAAP